MASSYHNEARQTVNAKMNRQTYARRSTINELCAQFRPCWSSDMLSDARRNAESDLRDAGWDENEIEELIELAIDITRE